MIHEKCKYSEERTRAENFSENKMTILKNDLKSYRVVLHAQMHQVAIQKKP